MVRNNRRPRRNSRRNNPHKRRVSKAVRTQLQQLVPRVIRVPRDPPAVPTASVHSAVLNFVVGTNATRVISFGSPDDFGRFNIPKNTDFVITLGEVLSALLAQRFGFGKDAVIEAGSLSFTIKSAKLWGPSDGTMVRLVTPPHPSGLYTELDAQDTPAANVKPKIGISLPTNMWHTVTKTNTSPALGGSIHTPDATAAGGRLMISVAYKVAGTMTA